MRSRSEMSESPFLTAIFSSEILLLLISRIALYELSRAGDDKAAIFAII